MTRKGFLFVLTALCVGVAAGYLLRGEGQKALASAPTITQSSLATPATSKPTSLPSADSSSETNPIDEMVAKVESEYGACNTTAATYAEASALWDREMNVSYQKLMKELKPEAQKQLKETQRSWIKFRDDESKFLWTFSPDDDGSMARSARAEDRMLTVKRRAKDLSVLYWWLHYGEDSR